MMKSIKERIKDWLNKMKVKRHCKNINHKCDECEYCVNNHDWWGCPYNL